ncbi:MAG: molybdate ABC transporter substrate-binding protein, partial [Actinomycetota bacterium]
QGRSSASDKAVAGNATVFAAASLTESFTDLKAIFEAEYPGATITLNLGPSSGLAAQIVEQGGADAFASADQTNMKRVTDTGVVEGDPLVFIKNRLQIIVAPGNPRGIKGLSDLVDPSLKVVLAAPQVPVGKYAREALDKAGITVKPVSEAVDVKGVVGPVTLGEADAGIVYASDIEAAGNKAAGVDIPEEQNVVAEYPIGVIKDSPNHEVALKFVDLVLSDRGREVLTGNGFTSP